jgi:dynein heavy chain
LIERDSYNHIKELSFFKKFKRWKFMRMWKKTVKRIARMKASNALEDKLFYLHPIFRKHLMKHRSFCTEMEKLRFVNLQMGVETQSISEFGAMQQKCRSDIEDRVKDASEQCRKNISESISKVLSELRERIVSEIALDEERKKNNPIQSSTALTIKQKSNNSVFEALGFPEGMTYGHRSSLRKECSRFLRFAYLIDFISLESLSNIYTGSVEDMILRLKELDYSCELDKIIDIEIDETHKTPAPPNRANQPMFYVKINMNEFISIPDEEVVQVQIEEFKLPP